MLIPGKDEDYPLALNEDKIARIFADRFEESLRFCHDSGCWHVWDGVRWKADRTDRAMDYTRKLCRSLNVEGHKQFAKASTFAAVERIARADRAFAVTQEVWDRDPWLLNTPGGIVDLRTGKVRATAPGDFVTKLTGAAPDSRKSQPWLDFLEQATQGDIELQRFLQRFAGYALTGKTSEECLLFVYGPGGNGKGVFLEALTGALGDYARWATMDAFMASTFDRHSTDLAMLAGARLVVASETREGRAWDEGRIKALTGGDHITARLMRQDNFTYTPQFKLLLIGNHKPALRTVDEAARRRFHIVPFLHSPTQRDPNLKDRLRAEWGAILFWAIEGCLAWQRDGLQVPEAVRRETESYFETQDVFSVWLEERCEQSSSAFEPHNRLFSDWKEFAEANHEDPGSTKAFTCRREGRGFAKDRFSGVRGFRGIRLKQVVTGDRL